MTRGRKKKYVKWTLYVEPDTMLIAKQFNNISKFFRKAAAYYMKSEEFRNDIKKGSKHG